MTMTYVLVEGFYDREFWAEWLLQLGWTDPGARAAGRVTVIDSHGKVEGGMFGFRRGADELRVVPCQGDTRIVPRAKTLLKSTDTHPIDHMVLTLDSDAPINHANPGAKRSGELQAVESVSKTTKVDLITWRSTRSDSTPALPGTHTLERLIMEAVLAAHPERGDALAAYLTAAPVGPADGKAHAWAYMAKWHAEHGCSNFYRAVWHDERVAVELSKRLTEIGAAEISASLGR